MMAVHTAVSAEELIAVSRRRARDFRYFAENHLRIRSVDFRLIPFKLNRAQLYIDDLVEGDLRAGRPVRMIILKARQEGVSTYVEGRLFHLVHQTPFAVSMVVSHDDDSTQHLFDISRTYYDFLPRWMKPTTRYSNRKEIYLGTLDDTPLRSQMVIESALSKSIGRSWTLHGLHISELAFWPPKTADRLLRGLLQAVPEIPGTMVFIESTAQGITGAFYTRFWDAWHGRSNYRAVFIPWFWEPRYSKPLDRKQFPKPEDFFKTLTEYELKLMEKHKVTPEQLFWRRCKIADDFGGDEPGFFEEYPAEPEEAFVSTSKSVFHKNVLMEMLQSVKEPVRFNFDTKGKLVPAADGYLRVWELPKRGHLYVIGADVAEGLEKGDFSCGQVVDVQTLHQVCEWHGHIDADLFGKELCKLGKFYNEAMLAIESNNHGLTTIHSVVREGYPYVYRRKEQDTVTGEYTEKLGWQTNSKTKPLAIDALNEKIRERVIRINSRETIQECMTFVKDAQGHMGADGDNFDDRVMSLCIAVKVWEEIPKHTRKDVPEVPDDASKLAREERIRRGLLDKQKQRHEYLGELV